MEFTCPRCSETATAEFYGPCPSCREQLRAAQRGDAREVESQAFEPAMHVTPNAVALKDD